MALTYAGLGYESSVLVTAFVVNCPFSHTRLSELDNSRSSNHRWQDQAAVVWSESRVVGYESSETGSVLTKKAN